MASCTYNPPFIGAHIKATIFYDPEVRILQCVDHLNIQRNIQRVNRDIEGYYRIPDNFFKFQNRNAR